MSRVLVLAIAFAAATAAAGWWAVPVVAAGWVRVASRHRTPVRTCIAGATIGWTLLLGWGALQGPVEAVARRAGGAIGLPPWGFVLVTLLFPALLAGAAAQVARPSALR